MKKFARILSTLALSAVIATAAQPAHAATGQWSNTDLNGTYGLHVKWCSGGTGTISNRGYTTRNVCGFWLPPRRNVYAYVWETGTLLYDVSDCGDGRWIGRPFPSNRDTSRTAMVTVTSVRCP